MNPKFSGSDEDFDQLADAMDAAALAGTKEEDSDDESYYSASETV